MVLKKLPPLWLIILIVGIPQLSETVYTPSLPSLAAFFQVSHSAAEYTLTIYLFSFAIGTLFWGWLSDLFGRKICILYGMIIFTIGSLECYFASSFTMLMFGRFIQGFGGSIGSVLGQAVCRDSFEGSSLNKVYATVAAALAFFPAIGPVVGGIIAEFSNWHNIFIFLVFIVLLVFILTVFFLPETHHRDKRKSFNFLKVAKSLLVNKHVMSMAFIVSVCNGIMFSSFAEGPFYLIAILGLTPKQYGMTFVVIAFAASLGGIFSRKMLSKVGGIVVMSWGIKIVCISNLILSVAVLICQYFSVDKSFLIAITILAQMSNMFGFSMTASNALSMALVDFKWCVGTASSIFGFFYYCLISFFTLLMGLLHNGTLIIMPLYFFSLSILMLMVYKVSLRR